MSPGSIRIVRCRREKQEMQRSGRCFFSPRSNFLKKTCVGGVARARIFYERSKLQWKFLLFVRIYRNRYIEVGISEENLALVKTNDQKKGNGEEEEKASSFLPWKEISSSSWLKDWKFHVSRPPLDCTLFGHGNNSGQVNRARSIGNFRDRNRSRSPLDDIDRAQSVPRCVRDLNAADILVTKHVRGLPHFLHPWENTYPHPFSLHIPLQLREFVSKGVWSESLLLQPDERVHDPTSTQTTRAKLDQFARLVGWECDWQPCAAANLIRWTCIRDRITFFSFLLRFIPLCLTGLSDWISFFFFFFLISY